MNWLMILLVFGLFSGSTLAKELSEKDLYRETLELKSYAAEGGLVLRHYREGKVTATFVRIHSEKVVDALKSSEKKLAAPIRESLEPKRKQAHELARRLRETFQQLQKSASDSVQNPALATQFESIYRALEETPDA